MIRRNIRKPYNITSFYSKLIGIGILVVVVIFVIVEKVETPKNINQSRLDCYFELNKEIKGTVAKAFFDDNINVKAFVIYFTNGEKYINPIFEKSLSGFVNVGDSIYKRPGTFNFVIFRKRYENPIIVVKDTIDCGKLYDK